MQSLLKFIVIIVIALLLGTSVYVIFFTSENNDNGESIDTIPPAIDFITGNTTGTAGKITTITVTFSDNVAVTQAILYYKKASASSWDSTSIINGSVDLPISSDSIETWYYYITVNDASSNGPVGNPSVNGSKYYTITVTENNENIVHTVFVEEGTATRCNNCPIVANVLHTLYESNKYRFYYVSLVEDKNTKAHDRLYTDYNILGFPTVFVDGGFKVIAGSTNAESACEQAISTAQSRDVPQVKVRINAEYKNDSKEMIVNVQVINQENQDYTGRLKVYVTEIISQWTGYDGKPYHFSFVDYAMNKDITIDAKGDDSFSETKDISSYDYENLMLIAVVFSSEKNAGLAQPPDQNPFDAYYADATNATTLVQGGNLPPVVEIASPQKGKIYFNGNPTKGKIQKIFILGFIPNKLFHNKTYLFGWKKIIQINATDESGIAKVEFYIDGTLVHNTTQAPYEWTFKKVNKLPIFPKKHTLQVIGYDSTGKTSEATIDFIARI